LALAMGCGGTVDLTPHDAGPTLDGAPPEARTLELVGPPSLELLFDEAAELSVRERDTAGLPVPDADIAFALEGNANDSTLGTLGATTNMDGLARGRVLAGHTATTFQVRITATGAAPLYVQVSVSGHGFGQVDASIDYAGRRPVDHLEAMLFAGAGCATALMGSLAPDRRSALGAGVSQVLFTGLPALVRYSLAVEGKGPTDVTLARGCLEDVLVSEGATANVSVTVQDLSLDPSGEYDATLSLTTDTLATTLSDALRTGAQTQIEDAGGDVSVLLDALNRHFLAAGDVTSVALLAAERSTTSLEADLDARLIADGSGPSVAFASLADAVDRKLARVEVSGVFTLGPDGGSSFTATQVSAGEVGSPLVLLDLASLGVHVRTTLSSALLADADGARIDAFDLQLPGGVLSEARVHAMALAAGVDSAAPWLAAHAGCDSFAAFLAADPALHVSCDASCADDVCTDAMESVWIGMSSTLDQLDIERSGVELSGRLDFIEDTGDLRVDHVSATALTAVTTGEGAGSDTLGASVQGSRAAFLP